MRIVATLRYLRFKHKVKAVFVDSMKAYGDVEI
jgi:hypothetical protein